VTARTVLDLPQRNRGITISIQTTISHPFANRPVWFRRALSFDHNPLENQPIVKGNNRYGAKGTIRCLACQRRKGKVHSRNSNSMYWYVV